jgi:hypothetical protein
MGSVQLAVAKSECVVRWKLQREEAWESSKGDRCSRVDHAKTSVCPPFTAKPPRFPCAKTEFKGPTHHAPPHFQTTVAVVIPIPTMPRVLQRTPEWLLSQSPGFSFFSAKASRAPDATPATNKQPYAGQSRTIAHGLGTEIFVAEGNEVRWADLKRLKDGQQLGHSRQRSSMRISQSSAAAYKVGYRASLWMGPC